MKRKRIVLGIAVALVAISGTALASTTPGSRAQPRPIPSGRP